jgi:uncharacterized membrane protein YdfJ with MMPL/SSD domain
VSSGEAEHPTAGSRVFAALARGIIRHPWYPVIFWVALLVVVVPFLPLLGSVTTNSTETLPSSAPSAAANAEFHRLFPSESGGSSSILLFVGPNLTDANGQGVIQNVTAALLSDRSLQDVASIESVYTAYASYLAGQVEIAAGGIAGALGAATPLPVAVNQSAALFWGPPAAFVAAWSALAGNASGNASVYNYPAYEQARSTLAGNASALAVLSAFYDGYGSSAGGFNGTPACAAHPATVIPCADAVARLEEAPLVPLLVPVASERTVPLAVLAGLGLENRTAWPSVQAVAVNVLAVGVGFPARWVATVWALSPSGDVTSPAALAWANATVSNHTLWTEPLPVPHSLTAQYVASAGTASLIAVSFTVDDSATDASGGSPVYSDLSRIDHDVGPVLATSDRTHSIAYYQTGSAPLDQLTNTVVNATLALVLPLTVGLLLLIAMVYFRSPLTPLVTFAGLGIALTLALGGTILLGTLFGAVDTTSLTLEEVFVLGVGTDYSIFLVARYREELHRGRSPDEAIEFSLAWAGQSVATSGSTAIIATVALTFSGVALLSQWGRVLSLAVLITLLLSVTLVPAFLKLIGPRIFWPDSGERFRRRSERANARIREERTYFYRVGRATQRRPAAFLGVLLLVSVPLVVLAVEVPLAYDFYGQLPSGHAASNGLEALYAHYGNGFATPSFALVTFVSPLHIGNRTNATEFQDVAALAGLATNTSGIAVVQSPVGPFGAPLSEWENLSSLPLAPQQNLLGALDAFVGTDHRTVLVTLQPAATGLSSQAVASVRSVESAYDAYQTSHREVTALAFGGGAPTIGDLADETATATDLLIVAVTVGLVVVLVAVLRSWIMAVMAVATIGLSISWAWALTYLVFQQFLGFPLFFYVRTILFLLILGLGIDYNIFLLTRVREERVRGATSSDAVVTAVGRTGGIITAAALILASAFAAITVGEFTLIRAIGFSVAVAVVLDAMVVRTYLVPSALQLLGDRAWNMLGRKGAGPASVPGNAPPEGSSVAPAGAETRP